jgi:hypothetical protein
MSVARLRMIAGFAILAGLVLFGVLLIPVYWRNYQFQQSLDTIALKSRQLPDDEVRSAVIESAARLNLPVKSGQVRLRRSDRGVEIEVRYAVPVDMSIYTVDLHFKPRAK